MAFIESSYYIGDPTLYSMARTVKIQRPCSETQFRFFREFLKPLSDRHGFWIIMDVDDCLVYEDIPKYNIARETYGNNVKNIIRRSMEMSDFITTTTEYIRDYYVNKFGIPKDKFIIIPNYLPRWWIGNCFNIDRTFRNFTEAEKSKLKIAFVCGGNHYDLQNVNDGKDDFSGIVDWIKDNVNEFDFRFVGGIPVQLIPEYQSGKIHLDPGVDVLNYPREIYDRNYNIWVCPLEDNVFNRCKSNIKLIEAWSMGIPILVQKCECYNKYTSDVFEDGNDLDNKISELIRDKKTMIDKLVAGRRIVDFGDNNAVNGWWLEKNMNVHDMIFSIPQRTMRIDMNDLIMENKENKNA